MYGVINSTIPKAVYILCDLCKWKFLFSMFTMTYLKKETIVNKSTCQKSLYLNIEYTPLQ